MAEEMAGKTAGKMSESEKGAGAESKTLSKVPTKAPTKASPEAPKESKGKEGIKERILTVNLRGIITKKPSWRRSMDSARMLKEVLKKQTKAHDVKISKSLNEKLWGRGMGKPPNRIRVKIISEDDSVRAELME